MTHALYLGGARDFSRNLSHRAQRKETKGIHTNRATEIALASVYKRSFISDV
jgi:hypothetical protein